MHPWGYTKEKIGAEDLAKHQAFGAIADKHLNIEVGTTGDILGYYPLGTSRDYYYDQYRTVSFTFEGRYKEENALLDKHVSWWEDMVQLYLERYALERINVALHWSSLIPQPFPS